MVARIRRATLLAIGLLVALAILGAAAVSAVRAGWLRERILTRVETLASESLGSRVTIGAIEGPLWPDIVVRNVALETAGVSVRLERAEVRWSLMSWPIERVRLDRVHLVRPTIERLDSVATELGPAETPGTSGTTPDVEVARATVEQGRLIGWGPGPVQVQGRIEAMIVSERRSLPQTIDVQIRAIESEPFFEALLTRATEGSIDAKFVWRQVGADVSAVAVIDPSEWLQGGRNIGVTAAADIGALDPGALIGRDAFEGTLAGRSDVKAHVDLGQIKHSSLEASLQLDPEPGSPVTAMTAELALAEGRWAISRLDARGQELRLRGDGAGDLERIDRLRLHIEVPNLQRWTDTPPDWMTGGLVIDLDATGSFDAPTAKLDIVTRSLHLGGARQGSEATLRVETRAQMWHVRKARLSGPHGRWEIAPLTLAVQPGRGVPVTDLRLRGPGGELAVAGFIALDPLRLDGVAFRTDHFDLATLAPILGLPWLTGEIEGRAEINGAPANPDVSGDIRFSAGSGSLAAIGALAGGRMQNVEVTVDAFELRPWAALVGAELPGAIDGRFTLSGAIEEPSIDGAVEWRAGDAGAHWEGVMHGTRIERAQLRLVDLDLGTLVPPDLTPAPLEGRLNAELSLRGPLQAPAATGTFEWKLDNEEGEPQALRGRLVGDERVLRAEGTVRAQGTELAVFEIAVPQPIGPDTLSDPALALTLRADGLDLGMLRPFLPKSVRRPAGRIEGTVTVTGGVPSPLVDGGLRLRDAGFDVPALRQRFHPISADIALSNDRIEVRDLRGGPPDGALSGRGHVRLEQLTIDEVEMSIDLEHFALARTAAVKTDVSGHASLSGSMHRPELRGEFRLEKARFAPPRPDDPLLQEIRIQGLSSAQSELQGGAESVATSSVDLDVSLTVPPGTWVRGQGAELEVEGKLRYSRRPDEVGRYDGRLSTIRGTYRLQGRTLAVDRGQLIFAGQSEFDPNLDVAASAPVGQFTLRVKLSGPLSSPSVELSSEPALPQSDVIALLVFGRTTAELDGSRAAGVDGILAAAGASFAVDQLRALVGEHLPVDTLGVDVGEKGAPSRVRVGRYLGEKLFVQYGRSLGAETDDEVRLEWKITPRIRIESSATTSGEAGADVVWGVDY